MSFVVIRLGQTEYHGREGDKNYALMRFLNAVMYPHQEDFMDIIQDYIDYNVPYKVDTASERDCLKC